MSYLKRYGVQFVFAVAIVVPTMLSGCILVVEEDRDHDRRHRYGGTDWFLEVVIYGARTYAPADGDVQMTFLDETRFEGVSLCGPFSGNYSVSDDDAVKIESFSASSNNCEQAEASSIFLSQLRRSDQLVREENRLRAEYGSGDYMLFVEK